MQRQQVKWFVHMERMPSNSVLFREYTGSSEESNTEADPEQDEGIT